MKTKAIVYVQGGVVQNVISNDPDFEVKVVDYDNEPDDPDVVIDEDYYVFVSPDAIVENIEDYKS